MVKSVFIIGATGMIGSELTSQIVHIDEDTRIVGVASSTDYLFSRRGIDGDTALGFSQRKVQGKPYGSLENLLDVAANGSGHITFVDATGENRPMTDFQLAVIQHTPNNIVTPNKCPVALSAYPEFVDLTIDPSRYGYRCSVMAGSDAVPRIRDRRRIRSPTPMIMGCFSGTLGYTTTSMEEEIPFSIAMASAYKLGYTEHDPRVDGGGVDVGKKVVVLARTAGYDVGMEDVNITSYVPEEYLTKPQSVDDFMASLHSLDSYFREMFEKAKRNGVKLRYVGMMDATGEKPKLEVSLREVPLDDPLAQLKGRLNMVVLRSGPNDDSPYSICAAGAGPCTTAENIRTDLLYLR